MVDAAVAAVILLAELVRSQSQNSVTSALRIGETFGEITVQDASARTDILDREFSDAPVRANVFTLQVAQSGQYSIELRSHFFDAYLVLRQGEVVVAENDDGLLRARTHARVTASLVAGQLYSVEACAVHGGLGSYAVRVIAGQGEQVSGQARDVAVIEDARQTLIARELKLGEKHEAVGDAAHALGSLLYRAQKHDEAKAMLERALAIREGCLGPEHAKIAKTLGALAVVARSMDDNAAARRLCEQALAMFERTVGPTHVDVAAALQELASVLEDQGLLKEARPLLDRALAIRELRLGKDHVLVATTLNNLAQVLDEIGAHGEARAAAERALSIYEQRLGEDHLDVATALITLAMCLRSSGSHREARPLLERALSLRERALGRDHVDVANCLNELALVVDDLGDHAEAVALLERALAIREQRFGKDHLRVATVLHNLAGSLADMAHYELALLHCRRALAIREKRLGPDHMRVATTLNQLGSVLKSMGRLEEARVAYERALSIREQRLGKDDPGRGTSLHGLAMVLQEMGAYYDARPLMERALALAERVHGESHTSVATSLSTLGVLLRELGENEEALALHMRALKIREQRLGDDHPSVATSLSNLAVVLERLGRSEEARRCYERSIRIKELRFGPDHPDLAMTLHSLAVTLGKAGKVGEARPLHYRAVEIDMRRLGADHPDVAQNLSDLMHLAVIAGQLDEARQLAVRTCKSRLAWLRREIPLATERSRLRYAGEAEHDVSVLCQLAVGSGFDAGDAAFALAASWKGIVFRSARVASSQRETWTAEQHKLAATIQSLQATASKLGYQRDVADPQAHASQLRGVLADLERSQVELARGLGLRFDDADVSVSDFARLLPLGTALIDFLVTSACDHDIEALRPRLGSRRLLAWVLRSGEDHAALVDLGSADAAEARVGAFLEARRLRSAATGPNDELDRSFWQPLAEHLNGVETVFVCPDQFLGRLSLAGIRTSDGRYLIERYRFLYMQDAGSLAAMLRAGPRARAATPTLLAVGGVDYDQRAADASSTPAVPAAPSTTDSRGLAKRWQPLPQSKTEVEAIAGIHVQTLPAAARRLVLLGMEPTEERVKTEASRFTLLHFATHGYFESKGVPSVRERTGAKTQEGMERRRALYRPDSLSGLPFGLLSGLALAGSNRRNLADREEGLLTAEEVAWLPLGSCDLVVLSACETGIGMARGGEGMLSLRRAFHLAGAQTVISSLSRVEDAATERLMTEFYRRLWGDKVSPHEAFRAAQLALLRHYRERDQRDPRPDTWGAFVLSGEWR